MTEVSKQAREPTVTQADRERAAPFALGWRRVGYGTMSLDHLIRQGQADDEPLVQAFASHRIAALSGRADGAEDRPDFAPCPTCRQYSHTIGEDRLAQAFLHFQSMFDHRGDGMPTQYSFSEATRDAAQVLMTAARLSPSPTADAMRKALEECEARFREYERHHRAKIRPRHPDVFYENATNSWNADMLANAERNREMADMCRAALQTRVPVEGVVERARELLAEAIEPNRPYAAKCIREGHFFSLSTPEALRAIERALQSSGLDEAIDALEACLAREAEWTKLGGVGDRPECNCIILSRDAEREYETGTCPHQRARTTLANLRRQQS